MALAQLDRSAAPPRRALPERLPAWGPGVLVAAALAVTVLLIHNPQVLRGDLIDTDSYLHVVRLRSFLADGGWHGGFFFRDNAPFGLVLNWTKAYDLVFLALAAPIAALGGWDTALALVAPAVGPLATFALILAGVWAAAPICGTAERRLIGFVLAIAPMVLFDGSIGDADHHLAVAAAWMLFLGLALRVAMVPAGLHQGIGAGLAAAFSLWLSVECILGVLLGIALMGLAWIRAGERLRRASLAFAAAFALAVAAMLTFDPPYGGWLQPEAGRISILYVTFAGLLALLWAALAVAPQDPRAWRARLAVVAAGAVLSAICFAALFPIVLVPEHAVFGGDNELKFWNEFNEMQPALRHLKTGILAVGAPMIGLLVAFALAWRERRTAAGQAWAMFALMLSFLTALALLHVRFAIYAEALAALPIAVLLARVGPFVEKMAPRSLRHLAHVLAGVTVLVGPNLAADVLTVGTAEAEPENTYCSVSPVAAPLNDPRFMGGSDLIIMTQPVEAAQVLYWTGHRVIDAPFHTNVVGIYGITHDLVQFMTSRDDAAARAIAARRGIAFVMLCPGDHTGTDAVDPDGRELYTRLLDGAVPGWLVAQPWPAGIASDLRLFRVVSPGGPTQMRKDS